MGRSWYQAMDIPSGVNTGGQDTRHYISIQMRNRIFKVSVGSEVRLNEMM